ncbi:hypothetical protein [Streptomyces sp. SID3343]|uniref:hypothetical protein n=1 Tax=Streptomyces sp. SID3343 TaxID=2690260 RepID=UPI00136A60B8|nr:hypothetical protein [Streptomyces sp. SID3343]MYV97628.1 hypothetical protein [Streptomyces sp. SID3343]
MRTTRERLRSGVVGRLNDEWDRLDEHSRTHEDMAGWARGFPVLGEYSSLGALEAGISTASRPRQDELLIALLALNNRRSALAGRALLQQMLPCAVRLAANRATSGEDFDDTVGLVLGHLYEAIGAYPYRRRTKRVAANLSLDTLHRVTHSGEGGHPASPAPGARPLADPTSVDAWLDTGAALERAVRAGVIEAADDALSDWREADPYGPRTPREDLVALLVHAVDAEALSRDEARMLAQDYRETQLSGPELAATRGVSYSALRKRHSRAVRRLRATLHMAPTSC